MNRSTAMPSEAVLERFVLLELDPARMEEMRRRCESDPALKARIEAIRASDPVILETYPPTEMARSIAARTVSARSFGGERGRKDRFARFMGFPFLFPGFRYAVPALAVLAFGAFLTVRMEKGGLPGGPAADGGTGTAPGTVTEEIRLKGAESGLAIFRKTRSGSELLPPQSTARPGDTLQVFYHSRKALFGVVFSMDGAGSITLHYPETEGPAAALQAGSMLPLPHAFRLDKAPRFERFFLVTSPERFSSEGLLALVRGKIAGQAFPDTLTGLAEGFRQYPYTINKEEMHKSGSRKETVR